MAKVALITGANKGIGFEVARQLGHSGFTVLLGARASLQRTSATQAEVRQSLPSKSALNSGIWMCW
jgi:NAD(P)-dependent dehydrogenase (short-subunit alcohol dehydrogenase family)